MLLAAAGAAASFAAGGGIGARVRLGHSGVGGLSPDDELALALRRLLRLASGQSDGMGSSPAHAAQSLFHLPPEMVSWTTDNRHSVAAVSADDKNWLLAAR